MVSDKAFLSEGFLKIPLVLGKATDGTLLFDDLAGMPHLLVAGATVAENQYLSTGNHEFPIA